MQLVEILPCEWFLVNGTFIIHKTTLECHMCASITCLPCDLARKLHQVAALSRWKTGSQVMTRQLVAMASAHC